MNKLSDLINQLEDKFPFSEKMNEPVSKVAAGWHIAHTMMTAIRIIDALEKSDPSGYHWKFNPTKLFVFTLNKIPRGKGKAPKQVQPNGSAAEDELHHQLQILRSKLTVLSSLQKDKFFDHPYFGHLQLKEAIKFLRIHTKHHLDIINEIIKN